MWIKRPYLLTEKVILFRDVAHVTIDFKQFHWKYLAHPSYNQNLVKARMCQWVQTLSSDTFFVGIKQVVYQRKDVLVSLVIMATAGGHGLYFMFS